MKSAMGLRFKSKRETRYEHKDECKIPNVHTALEFKYLSSRSALECAMKSAMGLRFKRKRETRYEHKDECKIPNVHEAQR